MKERKESNYKYKAKGEGLGEGRNTRIKCSTSVPAYLWTFLFPHLLSKKEAFRPTVK